MLKRALRKTVVLSVLIAGLLNSCSTDIDLLEEYKPITVVYGLLNANDSIQYIKVNKAFLGEGNALVMAQQKDSINYKPGEVTVQLQQLGSAGEVLQTINCDTTTLIPKDNGLFYNPYQLLFKTAASIDENSNYRVLVHRAADNADISAVTPVVNNVEVTYPPTPQTLIRFYNTTGNFITLTLKWKHSADAEIYTTRLRFTYYDSLMVAPFTKDTITLEMILPDVMRGTTAVGQFKDLKIMGEDFFNFIDASVNPNPNRIRWADDNLQIFIAAGAEDLNTYIQVNKPSIGLIQEKPTFTNITNGTGIFSSRWSAVLTNRMDGPTVTKANEKLN